MVCFWIPFSSPAKTLRTIAPKTPKIDIIVATLSLIFLFFIFTIIATIDVGIKNIKFVAWAMCCSIPHIDVNKKIKIVPPPIPVPLTMPETIPINISFNFLSPLYFQIVV